MGRYTTVVGFTAPGEEGETAAAYDLRRSTAPITLANFSSATPITTSEPNIAGTPECVEVSGLSSCTHYYFALRCQEECGAWSGLSNVYDASTTCSGSLAVMCEGDGLIAQSGSEEGWDLEGSLLETTGTDDDQSIRPLTRLASSDGEARVRLSSSSAAWALDAVSLLAVDRAASERTAMFGDQIMRGKVSEVEGISDGSDGDLAATLATGTMVTTPRGTRWTIDLGGGEKPRWFFTETGGGDAYSSNADSGITVQRQDSGNKWVTVAAIAPRREFTPVVVDCGSGDLVRLIFNREYQVRRIGRFEPTAAPTILELNLVGADHSRLLDVADALVAADEDAAILRSGERVVLRFGDPAGDSSTVRDYFLVVCGQRATSSQLTRAQQSGEETGTAESAPLSFALHPSKPNPFKGTTRIGFDLPQASIVKLEVFDLQGRRVARLMDGAQPAGRHSAEWDGRGTGGVKLQPGVYVYRLQAGTFRAQRKMVLVN
jgi:hypothetical protein